MHAIAIALFLSAAPSTTEAEPPTPPPAARPSAADSTVAAAFGQTIGTKPALVQAELSPSTFAAPGLAIASLAALAFALTRRRRGAARHITLLESTSLGPKRSLVIADVLGERLVLGVSEAGIAVLSARLAPEAPAPEVIVLPKAARAPSMSFFDRLLGRAPPTASFDDSLRDSIEDQELRAKLTLGQRAVAP